MKKNIAFIICALILLTSCGGEPISGEVVDKEYKAEWVQVIPMIQYVNNTSVVQQIPIIHEEGYYVKVRSESTFAETNQKEKYIKVTEDEYNRIEIGDNYEAEDDHD